MANPMIRGDMVEVTEFPPLAIKHRVQSVPQTVINETHSVVGTLPEMDLVQEILKAIGK
jgi:hypothetical protein